MLFYSIYSYCFFRNNYFSRVIINYYYFHIDNNYDWALKNITNTVFGILPKSNDDDDTNNLYGGVTFNVTDGYEHQQHQRHEQRETAGFPSSLENHRNVFSGPFARTRGIYTCVVNGEKNKKKTPPPV